MQIFIVFEILEIWSLSNDLDKLEQPKILEHRISRCDDLWVDTIWLSIFIIVLQQLQKEKKEKLTRKWKKKVEEFFQEISNPSLLPNIFLSNIYSYLLEENRANTTQNIWRDSATDIFHFSKMVLQKLRGEIIQLLFI